MAKRLDKRVASKPAAKGLAAGKAAPEPVNDLEVLAPEAGAAIGGEVVVVREYGFFEGARIAPIAAPLLADLQAVFGTGAAPQLDSVMDVLIEHADITRRLLAIATVQPSDDANATAVEVARREKWLETLNDADGELMLLLWWQANSGFFIRRLLRNAAKEKVSQSAGAGSSTT